MKSTQGAYTLTEMVVVLSLMSIILLVSVRPFSNSLLVRRLPWLANDVQQILAYARHAALLSGQSVLVCGWLPREQRCEYPWGHHLAVVSAGKVLRVLDLPSVYRLVWSSSLGRNRALVFLPSGTTEGQNGRLTICPERLHALSATWSVVVTHEARLRRQYELKLARWCHPHVRRDE